MSSFATRTAASAFSSTSLASTWRTTRACNLVIAGSPSLLPTAPPSSLWSYPSPTPNNTSLSAAPRTSSSSPRTLPPSSSNGPSAACAFQRRRASSASATSRKPRPLRPLPTVTRPHLTPLAARPRQPPARLECCSEKKRRSGAGSSRASAISTATLSRWSPSTS